MKSPSGAAFLPFVCLFSFFYLETLFFSCLSPSSGREEKAAATIGSHFSIILGDAPRKIFSFWHCLETEKFIKL
jgi:hypothetical protein